MENYMETLAKRAKAASVKAARIGGTQRDRGLRAAAEELLLQKKHILEENEKDMKTAREKGIKQSLLDRLQLNEKRIEDMAEGLRQVSALESPVPVGPQQFPADLLPGGRRDTGKPPEGRGGDLAGSSPPGGLPGAAGLYDGSGVHQSRSKG